jgi:glutamate synthase (ferredoxin)
VATQDPALRAKFTGDPSHVVNFMMFIAQEVRELMAELGFRTVNEMVGHSELLQMTELDHWKARHLDLSQIFYQPDVPANFGRYCQTTQHHDLDNTLDSETLLELCRPALRNGEPVSASLSVRNIHRAVGTRLGSEVTRQYGPAGLPHDTIQLRFEGSAGQSFGAFIPKGITLRLEGDANDYLGKGLSGGKIIVVPPTDSTFIPAENVIAGNVAFYGATSGEAYLNGIAGQRFCVRNSGANVVIEAVGDHGCEYMTGGRVVVLGAVGRNFGAGMSGGIAYLVDDNKQPAKFCNLEMVSLTSLEDQTEIELVKDMIFRHAEHTGSRRATEILLAWDQFVAKIIRILPNDYRRALEEAAVAHA